MLSVGWRPPFLTTLGSLSAHMTQQLVSPRASDQIKRERAQNLPFTISKTFYSLISEMACHHFCVCWSHRPIWIQCGPHPGVNTKGGVIGGHPRGCLPHYPAPSMWAALWELVSLWPLCMVSWALCVQDRAPVSAPGFHPATGSCVGIGAGTWRGFQCYRS